MGSVLRGIFPYFRWCVKREWKNQRRRQGSW